MLPDVAGTLALPDRALGMALAAAMFGAVPAMHVAGRGGDQPGVPLIAPLMLALAAVGLLPLFAAGAVTLGVAMAAIGAASGALDVLMNAQIGALEAADGQRRMHLAHAVYSAGLFAASVLAGLLRQAGWGFRPILLLAMTGIVLMTLGARHKAAPAARSQPAPAPPAGGLAGFLLTLGLLCAVAFMLENGMEMWSALYLGRFLAAQPAIAALGPGILGLSAVAGRIGGQALAGRLGDARLLLLAGGAAALGVLGFTLAPSWPLALPALLLSGSGISLAAPTFFGLAARWAGPGRRGAAVSRVTLVSYLGFLVGPLYLGSLSSAIGLRLALLSLTGCAVILGLAGSGLVAAQGRRRAVTAGSGAAGQIRADLL